MVKCGELFMWEKIVVEACGAPGRVAAQLWRYGVLAAWGVNTRRKGNVWTIRIVHEIGGGRRKAG